MYFQCAFSSLRGSVLSNDNEFIIWVYVLLFIIATIVMYGKNKAIISSQHCIRHVCFLSLIYCHTLFRILNFQAAVTSNISTWNVLFLFFYLFVCLYDGLVSTGFFNISLLLVVFHLSGSLEGLQLIVFIGTLPG